MARCPDRPARCAADVIEIVAWPTEERRRRALASSGVPRVLVVERGVDPPENLAVDEDWVRAPASADEIEIRARRVLELCGQVRADTPYVDEERVLHRWGRTVRLTRLEANLLQTLLDATGRLVPLEQLNDAGWAGRAPSRDSIHTAITRLRRRTVGLGMLLRSVRDSGYVVETGRS